MSRCCPTAGSPTSSAPPPTRRRNRQLEFNTANGITPRGIQKAITDIMEGAVGGGAPLAFLKVAESATAYAAKSPEQAARDIKKLELEMHEAARNLEFERAAKLRDRIHQLRQMELGLPITAVASEEGASKPRRLPRPRRGRR